MYSSVISNVVNTSSHEPNPLFPATRDPSFLTLQFVGSKLCISFESRIATPPNSSAGPHALIENHLIPFPVQHFLTPEEDDILLS